MHPSAARLYEAAKKLKGKATETEIAALLGETDQVVNNWGRRGVSKRGAVKAQARIGCDATWLLEGTGVMVAPSSPEGWPFAVGYERFAKLAPKQKEAIESAVAGMIQGYEAVNKEPPSGGGSSDYPQDMLSRAA